MSDARLLTIDQLETGLEHIRQSPHDRGPVELIVRRPQPGEREVLQQGELSLSLGLVGDNWKERGYRKTPDGSAHPGMQLTVMNSRRSRFWPSNQTAGRWRAINSTSTWI